MRRLVNLLVSLAVLFGLVFGTIMLVRLANGDFAGDYTLNGTFPRAGEGLHPGSAVVFRGCRSAASRPSRSTRTRRGHRPHRPLLQGPGHGDGHDRAGQPVRGRADLHRHARTATPTPGRTSRRVRPSPMPGRATSWATCSPPPPRSSTRSTPRTSPPSWASFAGVPGRGAQDRRLHQCRHPAGRPARPDAQRAAPRPRQLRPLHPGRGPGRRRPQQPQRADQCRPPVVQRGGGRLPEPAQHPDPVLEPPGRAALDVPPRHRHHPRRRATTCRACCWPSRTRSAR